jgi:iron-sulfur cluster assembly accessory protein
MITLTERAATELKDLLQSQDQATSALRVWVQGGGCSGLSYGMALDSEPADESDQIFEHDGIKIYVDPMSLNYMSGSSVDYVDDVLGGGFKIENPNAVSGCGCGSSFKTADSEGAPSGGCGSCSSAR